MVLNPDTPDEYMESIEKVKGAYRVLMEEQMGLSREDVYSEELDYEIEVSATFNMYSLWLTMQFMQEALAERQDPMYSYVVGEFMTSVMEAIGDEEIKKAINIQDYPENASKGRVGFQ